MITISWTFVHWRMDNFSLFFTFNPKISKIRLLKELFETVIPEIKKFLLILQFLQKNAYFRILDLYDQISRICKIIELPDYLQLKQG